MKVYKHEATPFAATAPNVGVKQVHTDCLSLVTWRFDKGSSAPRHAHPEEQIAYILKGRVEMITDNGTFEAAAGDMIVFGGNEYHGSRALEDTVLLDIFSGVREDLRAKFPSLEAAREI